MKARVIDASIVVKMYFDEEHSDVARELLQKLGQPIAPNLIWTEVANVVWKRRRKGELSGADAQELLKLVVSLPIQVFPSVALLSEALKLAIQFDRTVYDCLYLALAVEQQSAMISDDKKLINALKGTPLEKHIVWIGSLA